MVIVVVMLLSHTSVCKLLTDQIAAYQRYSFVKIAKVVE